MEIHTSGGGVVVGVIVATAELVGETDVDLLGVRVIEGVRVGDGEVDGGTPIVPAKL